MNSANYSLLELLYYSLYALNQHAPLHAIFLYFKWKDLGGD